MTEQKILELYNKGCTIREILKTLNISQNEYYKVFCKLRDENLITPRKHRQKNKKKTIKNYSHDNGCKNFHITKNNKYYACVKTEKQAQRMVELFRETDWDYSQRKMIKNKVLEEFNKK